MWTQPGRRSLSWCSVPWSGCTSWWSRLCSMACCVGENIGARWREWTDRRDLTVSEIWRQWGIR